MAVTIQQFNTLEDLFSYYNTLLFDGELPACLVTLSHHRGSHGTFAPERWRDVQTQEKVHEITLNPDSMSRPDKQWHSTLVHEMVHLWQEVYGKPSRQCYHNKEWAAKMEAIGLMPSDTGAAGGKKTGQSMTHYIIERGLFDDAFENIGAQYLYSLKLPYQPSYPMIDFGLPAPKDPEEQDEETENEGKQKRSGTRIKYSCFCENNVWGKPDLRMICLECEQEFKPQPPKEKKHKEFIVNQVDLGKTQGQIKQPPRPA